MPLFGPYAIRRVDARLSAEREFGPYQLVEELNAAGTSTGSVVDRVERFAVSGRVIAGTAGGRYFLFDASRQDPRPEEFPTAEAWRGALRAHGVPAEIELKEPDAVARTMTDRQLHPYDYRMMHGLWGLSDGDWAAVLELLGLLLSLAMGWVSPRRGASGVVSGAAALALGLVVDVVAEIGINGGGPTAFVGLVAFPLVYRLAFGAGRVARKWTGAAAGARAGA